MTRHGVSVVEVRILHPGAQKYHRNSGGGAGEYRAPIKTHSPVKANAARPWQNGSMSINPSTGEIGNTGFTFSHN
jgi:hypothetical protein